MTEPTAFTYRHGELYCENVPAADVAERYGTPALVYSAAALRSGFRRFADAFEPIGVSIAFPLRACPSTACLRILAAEGAAITATSGTELERAWLSTAPFQNVIFAGVGKAEQDIRAALDGLYSPLFQAGATVDGRPPYYRGPVGRLVAESEDELERIARIAGGLRISCRVALRIDPELEDDPSFDATPQDQTPPVPTGKFALPPRRAPALFDQYAENPRVQLTGLHMHLGPGVVAPDRFARAAATLARTAQAIADAGHRIDFLNFGGGFPAAQGRHALTPETYAKALAPIAEQWAEAQTRDDQLPRRLYVEPGRAIAAPAGHLLVGVRDIKPTEDRAVVIADAGVSPGRRPPTREGLVVAWPVRVPPDLEPPTPGDERLDTRGLQWTDIVGPSYAAGDSIAEGRLMPPVEQGNVIGVSNAGAYARDALAPLGDHPTPAEVMVDGFQSKLIRPRPSPADTIAPEPDAMHHTSGSKR